MLEYEIKCRRCGKMEVVSIPDTTIPYKIQADNQPETKFCPNCCKPTLWDVVAYDIVNESKID